MSPASFESTVTQVYYRTVTKILRVFIASQIS